MHYGDTVRIRKVFASGLTVPELGLGTLTWGRDTHEDEARGQLRALLDAGGSLVDTSPRYGDGSAQFVLGQLLDDDVDRADVTIVSKVGLAGDGTTNASRGAIESSVRHSLAALGTDYIDILVIEAPDLATPLDETLATLTSLVERGLIRFIGLSNFPGWLASRADSIQRERRSVPISALTMEYSLLQRGIERDVLPLALDSGMGVLAWSPLGRGVLTGRYRHSIPPTSRAASSHLASFVEPYLNFESRQIVEAVSTAADGLGCEPLDVALAWVLSRPAVACAITGARTAAQFDQIVAGLDTDVPQAILDALDDVTAPAMGYPESW